MGVLREVDGPANEEAGEVVTGPGGAGSFVVELADPGRTMGLESPIVDFVMSAKAL